MPPLKLTDPGGKKILDVYFASGIFTIELFTGAAPPSLADTDTGDAGLIATGGGYTSKTLSPNAATLVGGVPTVEFDDVEWDFTNDLTNTNPTIQGYWVFDADNVLIFEQLVTPFTPTAGDVYVLSPQYKTGNGTPA